MVVRLGGSENTGVKSVSERAVFRGRLIADGMWLTHLLWGSLTLPFVGGGFWACWMSTKGVDAAGALAFVGLLSILAGLVMSAVWKVASHAIVLRPDGLWCRPGFVRSVFIPYDDMAFLGLTRQGFLLAYEKQRRDRRVGANLSLPRWVLSNRPFRQELQRRAPRIQMSDETQMRLWAFKSRMGGLGSLWIIMLGPLIFLAMMWRPLDSPISVTGLISAAVVWVVALVALFVWQAVGERRIARQSRGSPTPLL